MARFFPAFASLILAVFTATAPVTAVAQVEPIGIVIMHGKGGGPGGLVAGLAKGLADKGYLVANLEMPWSGKRNYDVTAAKGEEEVEAALAGLRGKGAKKVFVCGHSQGGIFALHLAAKTTADGFITITPGGNVAGRIYFEQVGASLRRARQLVAEGKGNEATELEDYEGSKGKYPISAVPAAYVTWFDPDGVMNMDRAARSVNSRVPVLWVAATHDYPSLVKAARPTFRMLPKHPLTRFYEAETDHREAPTTAIEEITSWTREVTNATNR